MLKVILFHHVHHISQYQNRILANIILTFVFTEGSREGPFKIRSFPCTIVYRSQFPLRKSERILRMACKHFFPFPTDFTSRRRLLELPL